MTKANTMQTDTVFPDILFPDKVWTLSDGTLKRRVLYADEKVKCIIKTLCELIKEQENLPWEECEIPTKAFGKLSKALNLLEKAIQWDDF